jgi:hypothetical protein
MMSQHEQEKPTFALPSNVSLHQEKGNDTNEEPEDDAHTPQSPQSPKYKGKIIQGEEPEEDENENIINPSDTLGSEESQTQTMQSTQKSTDHEPDMILLETEQQKYDQYMKQSHQQQPTTAQSNISPPQLPKNQLEKKIWELNESVRRTLAKKIVAVYETLNKDLQISSGLINNNLIDVKEIWFNVSQFKDNLQTLSQKIQQLHVPKFIQLDEFKSFSFFSSAPLS